MLYLVDKPMAEIAFRTAAGDPDAVVVLIQDGVLLSPPEDVRTYAVKKDVDIRGVNVPPDVELLTYDALLELILDREVRSFV